MDESNSIDDPLDLFIKQQDEAISVTTQDTVPQTYRTKSGIEEPLAVIPPQVALPSITPYIDSISFRKNSMAYMFAVKEPIDLEFEHAQLQGVIDLTRYKLSSSNIVDGFDFDLPLLKILYTIIEEQYDKELIKGVPILKDRVSVAQIYVPDLLRRMGYDDGFRQEKINDLVNKIKAFEHVMGVLRITDDYGERTEISSVLTAFGYKPAQNILLFGSRYFEVISYYVQRERIRKIEQKNGIRYIGDNGMLLRASEELPLLTPGHSRLLNTSAYTGRKGDFAFELSSMLCVLIDRAGSAQGTEPHITVEALLEQCPGFLKALMAIKRKQHQNRKLKGTFDRVRNILKTQSLLKETYKNIKISIPDVTMDNLRSPRTVIRFPHQGRLKATDIAGNE